LRTHHLSKDLKEVKKKAMQLPGERAFQAERSASAKAMRKECDSLS
jgi:hypothetical protein